MNFVEKVLIITEMKHNELNEINEMIKKNLPYHKNIQVVYFNHVFGPLQNVYFIWMTWDYKNILKCVYTKQTPIIVQYTTLWWYIWCSELSGFISFCCIYHCIIQYMVCWPVPMSSEKELHKSTWVDMIVHLYGQTSVYETSFCLHVCEWGKFTSLKIDNKSGLTLKMFA